MKAYAVDKGLVHAEDFTDITEAVQALYDLAIHSMDYGSGFWSYEDAAPVAALAELMGWDGAEGLQKYTDDKLHETEASAWRIDNGMRNYDAWYDCKMVTQTFPDGSQVNFPQYVLKAHEHAFSTVGRCMWYQCKETEKRDG